MKPQPSRPACERNTTIIPLTPNSSPVGQPAQARATKNRGISPLQPPSTYFSRIIYQRERYINMCWAFSGAICVTRNRWSVPARSPGNFGGAGLRRLACWAGIFGLILLRKFWWCWLRRARCCPSPAFS